jgi:hypothetical protein
MATDSRAQLVTREKFHRTEERERYGYVYTWRERKPEIMRVKEKNKDSEPARES